jgi:glycosyltransferase involved in cell wall biosynthesis
MRLALVTQKVVRGDGQGRVNFEVARAAARHGWQVTLLTSAVEPELRAHDNVEWIEVPWQTRYTTLVAEFRFARESGRWLKRHRARFDLVHVNGFNTLAAGDVNAAHFVHGAWLRSPVHTGRLRGGAYGAYHRLYTGLNARLERWAYGQARVVVAVSERVRRELIGVGVPADRIRVIWNGVDVAEFRPGPADRAALGLPEEVPLALFAGNIRTPIKNLDTVLRALTSIPELHLAVVGALPGSPYPALAETLGVQNRVHFLGFRQDMADLMRAADLFVFPSRYEPFALVLLEAMASGLPVITVETVGAADLLTPECGVKLADPEDAAALAAAMQGLLSAPERRAQMGMAAQQVAECYRWDRMADDYLKLYQEFAPRGAEGNAV